MAGSLAPSWHAKPSFSEFRVQTVLSRDCSDKAELTVLLVLVQVEGRVKPFAHDESLPDLEVDFVSVEGLEHDEGEEGAERNAVVPDGQEVGAAGVYKVALSDVKQVCGGEA